MNKFLQTIIIYLVCAYSSNAFSGDNLLWDSFRQAARSGNVSILNKHIQNGFDINYSDNGGWSALHWANFSDQLEEESFLRVIDFLTKNSIDVNKVDKRGRTALHLLLVPGDDQIKPPPILAIQLLISSGSNLHLKDSFGRTPMSIGLNSEYPAIRKYFNSVVNEQD